MINDLISKNLCDSCINNECIFQSGIIRNHCDFYKAGGTDWKKDEEIIERIAEAVVRKIQDYVRKYSSSIQ